MCIDYDTAVTSVRAETITQGLKIHVKISKVSSGILLDYLTLS